MKNNIKTILIVAITIILSLSTSVAAAIAVNARDVVLDSDKTDKTNVADAIDDLYEKAGKCPDGQVCFESTSLNLPKCKRATTLHQETCNQTDASYYCSATESIGEGNTITYGNTTTTPGVLNTGDAFDCDVDGTGYNHRFYYVSDLYTGGANGSEIFDTNTAVLIYYSNIIMNGTTITPNNTTGVAYNSESKNYKGPVSLIDHIPSKAIWTNLSIKENRQIRSETGTTTTSGGTITFSGYTNKAARLLTTQEINRGCGITTSTMETIGALDTNKCRFLLENTAYGTSSKKNYWLETPQSSFSHIVWYVGSGNRDVERDSADNSRYRGVRPAIEVSKSDIAY